MANTTGHSKRHSWAFHRSPSIRAPPANARQTNAPSTKVSSASAPPTGDSSKYMMSGALPNPAPSASPSDVPNSTPGSRGRLFGRNGLYSQSNTGASSNARSTTTASNNTTSSTPASGHRLPKNPAPSTSTQNDRVQSGSDPNARPRMGDSCARRLSKRMQGLDPRAHEMRRSQAPATGRPANELEGTIPTIAELPGSEPETFTAELEGSMPATPFRAVQAQVIPAGTAQIVDIPKNKRSSGLSFRIRPDKTNYQVSCTSAAEDVKKAKEHMDERLFLIARLNAGRKMEGVAPLIIDDELMTHAQQHADNEASAADAALQLRYNEDTQKVDKALLPDTVIIIPSPCDTRFDAARVVSRRGLGAFACAERWYNGKFRGHVFPGAKHTNGHRDDTCDCRLVPVCEMLMSGEYVKIGAGKGVESGIWVVEVAGREDEASL